MHLILAACAVVYNDFYGIEIISHSEVALGQDMRKNYSVADEL